MKIFTTLFFVLFFSSNYGQNKFEYFGVLKLNGNSKTVISYRLFFELKGGLVSGYSVTDLGGDNETKNSISGIYNSKLKTLKFKEDNILYTKSNFSEKSFCFINYEGKIKLTDNFTKIDGTFKGLYKNKSSCIDGTISLNGSEKIYKVLNKIENKIKNSKKIDEQKKKEVNPVTLIDNLKVNNLVKDQNLNVFANSNEVFLEIYDAESEDGDVINLYQNGKLILANYTILKKIKRFAIILENAQNVFKIEAVTEGKVGFNTASIKIIDNDRTFDLKTSLKKDEKATISFIKN
ncbi:MAG: hypothetical protein KA133_02495 [Flavobacterium sp.]|nr:hypothetical protein [Flavobacterium sp.]